jgi:hypothetical protein
MLMGDRGKATSADSLQARCLRQCLDEQRAEIVAQVGEHATILTACLNSGELRAVSHHRGCIRQLENEIRVISRMFDALDRRSPDSA